MMRQGRLGLSLRVHERIYGYGRHFEFENVAPNSPAARCGLRKGDILKSVDDIVVDGWDIDSVTERLRGEVGTYVTLGILRYYTPGLWRSELYLVQREGTPQIPAQPIIWHQSVPGQGIHGFSGYPVVQSNPCNERGLIDMMGNMVLRDEVLQYPPIDRSNLSLPPQGARVGLNNMGNTCFLNSILQCLFHSVHFANYLVFNLDLASSKKDSLVLKAFLELGGHIWSGEHRHSLEPRTLLAALKEDRRSSSLFNYKQQDAHELLCVLLDILHEDTNGLVVTDTASAPDSAASSVASTSAADAAASAARTATQPDSSPLKASAGDWEEVPSAPPSEGGESLAAGVIAGLECSASQDNEWGYVNHADAAPVEEPLNAAAVDSVVSRFMGGRMCSEVTCNNCRFSTQNQEPFFVLSLSLPPRRTRSYQNNQILVEECLELLESEGTGVSWACSRCGHRDASKHMRVSAYPHCLIIHLKRFAYEAGRRYKRDDEVSLPVQGLRCGLRGAGAGPAAPDGEIVYNLHSWCEHLGSDDTSGHYTAAARTLDGSFLRFDDGRVSGATGAKMSGGMLRRGGGAAALALEDRIVSRSAYILFYERAGPGPAAR